MKVRNPFRKAVQNISIFDFTFCDSDCSWHRAWGGDIGRLWANLLFLGGVRMCSQKAQTKRYSCTGRGSVRHSIAFCHRLHRKCTILLQVFAKDQSRWRWSPLWTFWGPWWRGDRAGQVKDIIALSLSAYCHISPILASHVNDKKIANIMISNTFQITKLNWWIQGKRFQPLLVRQLRRMEKWNLRGKLKAQRVICGFVSL